MCIDSNASYFLLLFSFPPISQFYFHEKSFLVLTFAFSHVIFAVKLQVVALISHRCCTKRSSGKSILFTQQFRRSVFFGGIFQCISRVIPSARHTVLGESVIFNRFVTPEIKERLSWKSDLSNLCFVAKKDFMAERCYFILESAICSLLQADRIHCNASYFPCLLWSRFITTPNPSSFITKWVVSGRANGRLVALEIGVVSGTVSSRARLGLRTF